MSLLDVQIAVGLLLLSIVIYIQRRRKAFPLPPGPKGWPFIGNALEMPLEGMAPAYADWAKRLNSGIISATALGKTIVILDSYDVAVDLLDKRATKYSSRPRLVMTCELMGFDSVFAVSPYSEEWRERRKLFVRHFHAPSSLEQMAVPEAYQFVNRFLLELQDKPGEFHDMIRHMVGSLAIYLGYGLPQEARPSPLLGMLESTVRMVSEQQVPGKAVVDIIPWLKYIPEWLPGNGIEWLPTPGMGFKRFANGVRWMIVNFRKDPFERAVKSFGTGTLRPSFLFSALAALDEKGVSDEGERAAKLDAIQDVAATVFVGAGDTTVAAILSFIFGLAARPEIRTRIHEELDALLLTHDATSGKHTLRLPTFEDMGKLPILMAALMESQRWAPVLPTGVPHMTTEDDVYQDFFIPKGSFIIANQWSMLNDPKVYGPDVLDYNPDRFLRSRQTSDPGVEINTDVRHPNKIAFGFGRRICPGMHIAQSVLWLTAASMLTLFEFEAPGAEKVNYVNSQGKVDENFDPGFTGFPKKFSCDFKLRSDEARALLTELRANVDPER